MTEVERLFHNEVRDKKRTANNVHKKTGKRGYVGKMLTPYDMLKGKAKKEYEKGEIVVYNENNVMPIDEFRKLPEDAQARLLTKWREKFPVKELVARMGTHQPTFYKMIRDLGLGVRTYKTTKVVEQEKAEKLKEQEVVSQKLDSKEEEVVEVKAEAPTKEIIEEVVTTQDKATEAILEGLGLSINLEGTMEGQLFGEKLQKLVKMMENDDAQYKIKVEIVEQPSA